MTIGAKQALADWRQQHWTSATLDTHESEFSYRVSGVWLTDVLRRGGDDGIHDLRPLDSHSARIARYLSLRVALCAAGVSVWRGSLHW